MPYKASGKFELGHFLISRTPEVCTRNADVQKVLATLQYGLWLMPERNQDSD